MMRVATFNANSIRSRMEHVLAWLQSHAPDVLCIQETKVVDAQFPAAPILEAGYQVVFRGEKSYNGVAILSKTAPAGVMHGFDDGGPRDDTRLLAARIGPLYVLNTYVPQGRDLDHAMYAYKLQWFARVKQFCARHFSPRDLVVWVGDLNVARHPEDVYDPAGHLRHVCFHETVRAAFEDTLSWGFSDVFRRFHPEPGQFSFFDYRLPDPTKRKLGWRLDYILATAPLAAKAVDSAIDLDPRRAPKPSDHTPVYADFAV